MSTFQFAVGAVVAVLLAWLLWRQLQSETAKRADQGRLQFAQILSLFDQPDLQRGEAAGVWTLTGRYGDQVFQLKTVADTLATRKLPSLWLMVTLPEPQLVAETTDIMMRAAGTVSVSNFEFLPHTFSLPKDFPEDATIKSDSTMPGAALQVMSRHLDLFRHGKGKELLVSPKGLRIVVQLAEADRARYGVLREANFDGTEVDPIFARRIMDTLIELRDDLRSHAQA